MKTTAIFLFMLQCGFAYGQSFVNLNFESAVIPHGTAVGTYIPTTSGIPGWSAMYSQPPFGVTNASVSQIRYDSLSLGGVKFPSWIPMLDLGSAQ